MGILGARIYGCCGVYIVKYRLASFRGISCENVFCAFDVRSGPGLVWVRVAESQGYLDFVFAAGAVIIGW